MLVLCVIAYANSLGTEFVFDDLPVIVNNPLIGDSGSIPRIFKTPRWVVQDAGLYRPITLLTFHANHVAGGLNPFGYHVTNIALHTLVVLVLYALGLRLGLSWMGAFSSASLFAVHPVHTEAIVNIVGRAELLMSLGVLLALRWYIENGATSEVRPGYRVASLGAFSLALLSKEQAIVLPFIIILYDISVGKNHRGAASAWLKRAAPMYAGYFILLGALFALRFLLMGPAFFKGPGSIAFLDNPLAHLTWADRIPGALAVAGQYIKLFAWPSPLRADYSYAALTLPSRVWEAASLLTVLMLCALVVVAFWSYTRGRRIACFAIGFTLLTYAPCSNFIVPIGTIMGERLFYLPSAGLTLLIGAGLDTCVHRYGLTVRSHAGIVMAVSIGLVLIASILRTAHRNADWRDCKTIIHSSLETTPQSARVHMGLAELYLRNRNFDSAIHAFEEAARIHPELPQTHAAFAQNFGVALLASRKVEKAIPLLETAVRLDPSLMNANLNLGIAYLKIKDLPRAAHQFRSVLVLSNANQDGTYAQRAREWLEKITNESKR